MRLTAVHSRLGVRSGYCLSTLEEMGSQISSSTDGLHQPFLEQVQSLAIQNFTTSTAESDVIPSSDQSGPPYSIVLAMGNVNNATTHSTQPCEPSIPVLADTGYYAPTASSITTALNRQLA